MTVMRIVPCRECSSSHLLMPTLRHWSVDLQLHFHFCIDFHVKRPQNFKLHRQGSRVNGDPGGKLEGGKARKAFDFLVMLSAVATPAGTMRRQQPRQRISGSAGISGVFSCKVSSAGSRVCSVAPALPSAKCWLASSRSRASAQAWVQPSAMCSHSLLPLTPQPCPFLSFIPASDFVTTFLL